MQALGMAGAFMFLVFIGFLSFVCSGIILAAINQWLHYNFFFYYEGIPFGMIVLGIMLLFLFVMLIIRDQKNEIEED